MILITGASGTVGREVARALEGRAPLRRGLREPGPDGVAFDFGDPATFGPSLEGVDRVFLLRPPQLANARRDFGPFVEAMKAARIGQVVFLSVKGAARNRLLPHHGIERLIEASGLGWTHLRPNDFMQNFATVHRADIRERSEIWAPAGRGRTSFIDVRDIGEAAARVMTEEGHLGRAYTLTGAEALDLRDVATLLSEALGRTIAYRDPGALRFILRKRAEGHPLPFALVMTMVYTVARLGLAAEITPDLERLIGRPPTAFRTFARDYAQTWR